MVRHRETLSRSGELRLKRERQLTEWMWSMVENRLLDRMRADPGVRGLAPVVEQRLRDGTMTAAQGAQRIVDQLDGRGAPHGLG